MDADLLEFDDIAEVSNNPIDLLENMFSENDWPFNRLMENEMVVETTGGWCDYQMYFVWHRDMHALYFTCAYDLKIPQDNRPSVGRLLNLINERIWMGHFELAETDGAPTFRHTMPTRGLKEIPLALLEDIMDIGLAECERFFPAFQFHIWGGCTPEEAISSALLQCAGEA